MFLLKKPRPAYWAEVINVVGKFGTIDSRLLVGDTSEAALGVWGEHRHCSRGVSVIVVLLIYVRVFGCHKDKWHLKSVHCQFDIKHLILVCGAQLRGAIFEWPDVPVEFIVFMLRTSILPFDDGLIRNILSVFHVLWIVFFIASHILCENLHHCHIILFL